jgi:hypothetical protein
LIFQEVTSSPINQRRKCAIASKVKGGYRRFRI